MDEAALDALESKLIACAAATWSSSGAVLAETACEAIRALREQVKANMGNAQDTVARLMDMHQAEQARADALATERDEAKASLESLAWPSSIPPTADGYQDVLAHFRSMAARIVQSRDELKHENRQLRTEHARLRAALEQIEEMDVSTSGSLYRCREIARAAILAASQEGT